MVNSGLNVNQKVDDYLLWQGYDFPRTPTMNIKKRNILEAVKQGKIYGKRSGIFVHVFSTLATVKDKLRRKE